MKFYVGVTDNDWFDVVSNVPGIDEVNFWQPGGGSRAFRVLQSGEPFLFKLLRPQKNGLRLEIRLAKSEDIETKLNETGLDLMEYSRWGRYRIRLTKDDMKKHSAFLQEVLKKAFKESRG